jgi:hypothetical protein
MLCEPPVCKKEEYHGIIIILRTVIAAVDFSDDIHRHRNDVTRWAPSIIAKQPALGSKRLEARAAWPKPHASIEPEAVAEVQLLASTVEMVAGTANSIGKRIAIPG